jgi:hypothetical protein
MAKDDPREALINSLMIALDATRCRSSTVAENDCSNNSNDASRDKYRRDR